MDESKIKFSIDGMTDLHQAFQSILNDSRSLTEVWAEQGTLITNSLKEQLELLRQRNSIAFPPNANDSKPGSVGQHLGIDTGSADNKLDRFLRMAIYDGILISKVSLKELANIIGTRPSVADSGEESGPQAPTRAGAQHPDESKSDATQFFKSFVLTNLLRPLNSSDPLRAGLDMGTNAGMALLSQGGTAGWIGAALAGIASIVGVKYNAVSEVAPTAAEAARLLGGDWAEYVPVGEGQTQYGLRRNDILQRQMQLARAMGRQNLGRNFDQSLLWEQTTSLSNADITAFAQSARGSAGFELGPAMAAYFETLKAAGVSQERIETQMSEYLKELVTLNQAQLQQFGRTNVELNSAIYSAISSIFPEAARNNPALIGRMAQGFYTGMSSASSEQISALQYSVASRVMGDRGNWYEARMMREDPFGLMEGLSPEETARRRQYASELLRSYRSATGGTEQFAYLLEKQFGFTANQAYRFAQNYDSGKFSIEDFERQVRENKQGTDVEKQLREGLDSKVDEISKMLAGWEALKIGDNVDGIRQVADKIYQLLSGGVGKELEVDRESREVETQLWQSGGYAAEVQAGVRHYIRNMHGK